MDWETVVGLIGALGIGSTLTQYLSGGTSRREQRAKALAALGKVEQSRWAGLETGTHHSVMEAIRELRATAMVAGVPREPVETYAKHALAAAWMSQDDYEVSPDPEFAGGIDSTLNEIVGGLGEALAIVIWRPVLSRRRYKRLAEAALKKTASLDAGPRGFVDRARRAPGI